MLYRERLMTFQGYDSSNMPASKRNMRIGYCTSIESDFASRTTNRVVRAK